MGRSNGRGPPTLKGAKGKFTVTTSPTFIATATAWLRVVPVRVELERSDEMGFYLRKSISAGPLRFNLSKSGIGMSAGVKGLRVGTGPRGAYVHAGRNGVYYRQTMPAPSRRRGVPPRELPYFEAGSDTAPPANLEQDLSDLIDASSSDLVRQIEEAAALKKPSWFAGPFSYKQRKADWLAERACPVFYELDDDVFAAYEQLVAVGEALGSSAGRWYDKTEASVYGFAQNKGNAGAGTTVDRVPLAIAVAALSVPTFNFEPLSFIAPTRQLVFLPDQLLIQQGRKFGAVSYSGLRLEMNARQFITGVVPVGATPIGRTWKYVNAKGGPDKRYNDNPEYAVLAVWELDIHHDGAKFEFHTAFTDESAVAKFAAAIDQLASVLP